MTTYSNPGAIGDVVATSGRIEASWGNAIRDRVVNSFATTGARDTAIPSPVAGQFCVIGTTETLLQYCGATTGWQSPWTLPWGRVASATVTSDQGSITTTADVTSATTTWTAVANRRYRITVNTKISNTTVNLVNVYVTDGSNTVKDSGGVVPPNTAIMTLAWSYEETGISAGSTTRKLRAAAAGGTLTMKGTTGIGNQIIVEDMGPNGNPS